MNFVADEGVDRFIVEALRAKGYSVVYIAELSPGLSDDDVLDRANDSDAILITTDKDFGEIVFRQKRVHKGVILVRLYGQSSQTRAETIVAVLDDYADQLINSFAVVSPGIVRIRRRLGG